MICRELIELLEKKYPPSIAESWDNPVGITVCSHWRRFPMKAVLMP